MLKRYKVAIVGGHGLVAVNIIRDLHKCDFPIESLTVYGSKENANLPLIVGDHKYPIEVLDVHAIPSLDLVFFSGNEDLSYKYAEAFMAKGARIIDNSSYFRMYKSVPLVIPEINPLDLLDDSLIMANPNCTTILTLLAVAPLHKYFTIERISACTYQSASGAGKQALEELINEQLHGDYRPKILPNKNNQKKRLYDNILPLVDNIDENTGYTFEEIKMRNETQKIFHDSEIEVSATCVRIPTTIGHGVAIDIICKNKIDLAIARKLIQESPWLMLLEGDDYPDLLSVRANNKVAIGRLRVDTYCEYTLHLFATSDNLIRGASYNAVMIAQKMRELKIL